MRPLGYISPEVEIEKKAKEYAEHYYTGRSPDATGIFASRMKRFMMEFNEERIAQIILDEKRFRAVEYRGVVAAEVGDICYYKDPNEHKLAKLGRIVKLT